MEAKKDKTRGYTRKRALQVNQLIAISDTHGGCKVALCPPEGFQLDEGGWYKPSILQLKIWNYWQEFWNDWVPRATNDEPFAVVHNGDGIDGSHHGSTTQFTANIGDQVIFMENILKPIVDACDGRYYHVRGTEAHVGKSAEYEERLARGLGAMKDQDGNYARYELWYDLNGTLIHALHHISTTGSQAYESTAVMKELTESFIEAARWGRRPPDIIVRSHRHRCIKIEIPNAAGCAQAIVTPAWQAKTPFVWKIPGGRLTTPQFGGVLIRHEPGEDPYIRPKVWTINPPKPEVCTL